MVCPCVVAPLLMASSGFTAKSKKTYITFLIISILIVGGIIVYTNRSCETCPK